jgi:hypothetical protein
VISDAHEGLKAAITKVLNATWQRCRVHFMRNVLAHAGKRQGRSASSPPSSAPPSPRTMPLHRLSLFRLSAGQRAPATVPNGAAVG